MRHGKRSQPPSAPGTALADRAFCSSLWPKDLRPRKSCAWRAFFLLLLLLLSFILSLLSEGKMDWGLFLHCAALTFTLAGAPRSGKCHGGGTTSGLSLGNRGLATGPGGPGAGPDPRPVAGNFVPEVGVGGVRAPVPPAGYGHRLYFLLFGVVVSSGVLVLASSGRPITFVVVPPISN